MIEFSVKTTFSEKPQSDCLVVGVFEGGRLSLSAQKIDNDTQGQLAQVIAMGDCEGKIGQSLLLPHFFHMAKRVLLVGCGKEEEECTFTAFREITHCAAQALKNTGAATATLCLTEIPVKNHDIFWKIRQIGIITQNVFYRFDTLKSQPTPIRAPHCTLLVPEENLTQSEGTLKAVQAINRAIQTTKDLANLAPNICTPTFLAEKAQALAAEYPAIRTTVLEEQECATLGMGSFLSVTAGSNTPAKFIVMEYGNPREQKPIVLIGKGITFDTGGNSLKPASKMFTMKYDMCGGATVLAVLQAAAELALPLSIVGLVPTCENMPGPSATRPDDVVKSLSGTTIEILNTDAEGRLILADALTYSERYSPEVVIDIATLTGACVIALGMHASGLMSNDQALADALLSAGNAVGDRAWQLPLWDEYHETLKSDVADLTNISTADVGAGTIIAACFLSKFSKKYPWAHLDVAGTASIPAGSKKGATGRPVPLLVQYLLDKVNA